MILLSLVWLILYILCPLLLHHCLSYILASMRERELQKQLRETGRAAAAAAAAAAVQVTVNSVIRLLRCLPAGRPVKKKHTHTHPSDRTFQRDARSDRLRKKPWSGRSFS